MFGILFGKINIVKSFKRKLKMKLIAQKIRDLVAKAKEKEAIDLLLNLNSDQKNTVFVLSARTNDLVKQIMQGVVSWDHENIEKNKIRVALLDIADSIFVVLKK